MLESLKINLENRMDADSLFTLRQIMIDDSLRDNNIEMLKAISAIDKENLSLLQSEKNRLAEELLRLSKIKNYCD